MQTLLKLAPTRTLLLRAAARRVDGRVIPPDTLRGGARVTTPNGLRQRGWIEPAPDGDVITDTGYEDHPMANTATLSTSQHDFRRFLEIVHHEPLVCDIPGSLSADPRELGSRRSWRALGAHGRRLAAPRPRSGGEPAPSVGNSGDKEADESRRQARRPTDTAPRGTVRSGNAAWRSIPPRAIERISDSVHWHRIPAGRHSRGAGGPPTRSGTSMLILNPRAVRGAYPTGLAAIMNIARAHECRRWLSQWPRIARSATPLRDLPDAAQRLGVARLAVKDESVRSPLASFKVLGAPIALVREIARRHADFEPAAILTGRYADRLGRYTVITATDGNHGRALAAAARDAGCPCVIVLHAHVSEERERAIAALGARIVRIAGDYDESVREAARLATAYDWQVISDTSYEGYETIPRDVMQGYGTIAEEVVEATAGRGGEVGAFTHVFLQGGVGGLAAGVASWFWEWQGAHRPFFVVVEPVQADCLLQSAIQGRAARATGSVDSVMAGLACGETSPLAWRFLEPCVDAFMTIDDDRAVDAMRMLARGSERDVPIVAGESGAAGLAGLAVLCSDPALPAQVGLARSSRVLVVNTEGATAPGVYEALMGERPEAVVQRREAWSAAR